MTFGLSLVDREVLAVLAASDAPLTAAEVWRRVEVRFIVEPTEYAARGCLEGAGRALFVEHVVAFTAPGKSVSSFRITAAGRRALRQRALDALREVIGEGRETHA